jgi:hypothetical protein
LGLRWGKKIKRREVKQDDDQDGSFQDSYSEAKRRKVRSAASY